MTDALTLPEAFERAKAEAPGISEETFLEQTRVLIQRGRIQATAARAVIRHDDETFAPRPEICAASELDAREPIPADVWANLALWLSNGGSATGWGHARALPDRREFPDDGCFEGMEIYVGVVLIAESFRGLWASAASVTGSQAWTNDELTAWIREREKKGGARPPIRAWGENKALMTNRGVTKQRFENLWHELYPSPVKGRPRKNMP